MSNLVDRPRGTACHLGRHWSDDGGRRGSCLGPPPRRSGPALPADVGTARRRLPRPGPQPDRGRQGRRGLPRRPGSARRVRGGRLAAGAAGLGAQPALRSRCSPTSSSSCSWTPSGSRRATGTGCATLLDERRAAACSSPASSAWTGCRTGPRTPWTARATSTWWVPTALPAYHRTTQTVRALVDDVTACLYLVRRRDRQRRGAPQGGTGGHAAAGRRRHLGGGHHPRRAAARR